MAARKYPYKAFVVSPSLNIMEITLVAPGCSWASTKWDQAESGKTYNVDLLHRKRENAVAAAELSFKAQEERLAKMQVNLEKRRANLSKAKGEK